MPSRKSFVGAREHGLRPVLVQSLTGGEDKGELWAITRPSEAEIGGVSELLWEPRGSTSAFVADGRMLGAKGHLH